MRRFRVLWNRELVGFFLSPAAYFSMLIFLIASGWTFAWVLTEDGSSGDPLSVLLVVSVMIWMPIVITVVTMGLFAEEKRSGTLESLMTAPVTDWDVVMSKYAGALTFLLFMITPTASYPFIARWLEPGMGPIDIGSLVSAYIIVVVVLAFCTAIGLCASMLTRHQVVSAIVCFCGVCLPFAVGVLARSAPAALAPVLEYLSTESHFMEFARGSFDTRPVVLYLSGAALLLFVSVRLLETRRWT